MAIAVNTAADVLSQLTSTSHALITTILHEEKSCPDVPSGVWPILADSLQDCDLWTRQVAEALVLAYPRSNGIRLLAAMWLEQDGQRARAELVRVGVELDGMDHLELSIGANWAMTDSRWWSSTICPWGNQRQAAKATCRTCRYLPDNEYCRFHLLTWQEQDILAEHGPGIIIHESMRKGLTGISIPSPKLNEFYKTRKSGLYVPTQRDTSLVSEQEYRIDANALIRGCDRGFFGSINILAQSWVQFGDELQRQLPLVEVEIEGEIPYERSISTILPRHLAAYIAGKQVEMYESELVDIRSDRNGWVEEELMYRVCTKRWPGIEFTFSPRDWGRVPW